MMQRLLTICGCEDARGWACRSVEMLTIASWNLEPHDLDTARKST
jgi:hypothetical protein